MGCRFVNNEGEGTDHGGIWSSAGQPGTPFCHHLPSSIQARAFHFSIQEQQLAFRVLGVGMIGLIIIIYLIVHWKKQYCYRQSFKFKLIHPKMKFKKIDIAVCVP